MAWEPVQPRGYSGEVIAEPAPPAPAPGSEGRGFLRRAWDTVLGPTANYITGADRIPPGAESMQEFTTDLLPKAQQPGLGAQLSMAWNAAHGTDEQLAETLQKRIPGATLGTDAMGNRTITVGDQTYFVNRPGLSSRDVLRTLTSAGEEAASLFGAGKLLPAARGLSAMVTRAAGFGATAGGTEALRQGSAAAAGADTPFEAGDIAQAALGGAAGEPVAAALSYPVRGAVRAVRTVTDAAKASTGRGVLFKADTGGIADDVLVTPDMLNTTGQGFLRNAGYAPDPRTGAFPFTAGQVSSMQERVQLGGWHNLTRDTPESRDAARAVASLGATRIPATAGTLSAEPARLSREDFARNTFENTGEEANRLRAFDRDQGERKREVTDAFIPGAGRDPQTGTVLSEDAVGSQLKDAIERQISARRQVEQAAQAQPGAALTARSQTAAAQDPALQLHYTAPTAMDIFRALDTSANRRAFEVLPQGGKLQERIVQLVTHNPEEALAWLRASDPSALPKPRLRGFSHGEYNDFRRAAGDIIDAAEGEAVRTGNKSDYSAAIQLRNAVDAGVDGSRVSTGTGSRGYNGNISLLDEAQSARRASGERLALTNPNLNREPFNAQFMREAQRAESTGQEVLNALLGAEADAGGRGVAERLMALQNRVPPEAMEAAQAAYIRRLVRGTTEGQPGMPWRNSVESATNISKRITEALQGEGQAVGRMLLTADQRRELGILRDAMDSLVTAGTRNTSRTAYVGSDALSAALGSLPGLRNIVTVPRQVQTASMLREAVRDRVPYYTRPPRDLSATQRATMAAFLGATAGASGELVPEIKTQAPRILPERLNPFWR